MLQEGTGEAKNKFGEQRRKTKMMLRNNKRKQYEKTGGVRKKNTEENLWRQKNIGRMNPKNKGRNKELIHRGKHNTARTDASLVPQFKARFTHLEQIYQEFEKLTKELVPLTLTIEDYNVDDERQVRQEFYENFYSIKANFSELCGLETDPEFVSARTKINAKLPKIELIKFKGDPTTWKTFIDQFNSAVHSKTLLSNIDKFNYLLGVLEGPPLALVKRHQISAANYTAAYEALTKKYEDKRLIASTHYHALVNASKIPENKVNHLNLSALVDTYSENLADLSNLGFQTKGWDFILFNMLLDRLDSDTASKFESNYASNNEIPSFDDLLKYLQERCVTLKRLITNKPPLRVIQIHLIHLVITLLRVTLRKVPLLHFLLRIKLLTLLHAHVIALNPFTVEAIVLPQICGTFMPRTPLATQKWSHISNLKLADPNFNIPSNIDVLLGAEIFSLALNSGRIVGNKDEPIAVDTVFGWILMGNVSCHLSIAPVNSFCCLSESSLNDSLKRLWEIEDIPREHSSSPDDQRCEDLFSQTYVRNDSGCFTVSLPFRSEEPTFTDSRFIALRRYLTFERRLLKEPNLFMAFLGQTEKVVYSQIMSFQLPSRYSVTLKTPVNQIW
ncbi:hypothetical protein NQ315_003605 [Exocentrus adspersus]|uniref:Peptidase aspartic putative domain-containing protein n=1 Tax=Exocentrus adspersus TaxID=1586481 RepID=A0AAV8VJQ9_9CUCU|nr:hypothetical protein NQ315_003605 [Exocentrus adspersus]